MSTEQPNLSLPATATAAVAHFRNQPEEHRPVALYTLVELSDSELTELQQVCESETLATAAGENVRLAPQPRFGGQPLRAIYEYHVQQSNDSATTTGFNSIYFVVAIDHDWKENGVLLVTLDATDDDADAEGPECKVDICRVEAGESGLLYINLNIGNTSWSEIKEASLALDQDDDPDEDME